MDEHQYGIFLFDHLGTLAGIDVYSLNGTTVPTRLPTLEELNTGLERVRGAAQPAVAADGASRRR